MQPLWTFLAAALLFALGNALLLRKDVDHLTKEEVLNLQKALREVSEDTSAKGFTAIASYHGYPPQCKMGDKDVACCIHGDPTFPQWHREYVVQLEQALKEKGLSIGIPYWDWTKPLHHLPELVRDKIFRDPDGGKGKENIWYSGEIHTPKGIRHTARAIDDRLFQHVEPGHNTDLFEHVLDALEYPNYCQFEVQFEIAHNTIHYLVGGRHKYSMSHLEYTSYDPVFYIHHSNVDRIYTVYETIQRSRGYTPGPGCTGECELCDLKGFQTPMHPFDRDTNPFPLTKTHSKAYEATEHSVFGYSYENLTLNGYTIERIKDMLHTRQQHDRAFANFRLHGIGVSADITVKVCLDKEDEKAKDFCQEAGHFFILGGPLEMPWTFSRPYYFDITKTVHDMGLSLDGDYHVEVEIHSVNGTELPSDILPPPSVAFRPALGHRDPPISYNELTHDHTYKEEISVRKNVDHLTREEVLELREALEKFENDHSVDGYQAIAEFHGDPGKCPNPHASRRFACCIHGMPTFFFWHRMITVQVEDALRRRGSHIGIPYWDWTSPHAHLPELVTNETYYNPHDHKEHENPFHHANISFLGPDIKTSRDVLPELSQDPEYGDHTDLFDAFLLALEQDDFCDFAIQAEMAHNLVHGLIGGKAKYSMSSLSYSGFDPVFYMTHSALDRIWAIWTALQDHRGKPYKAHCAQSYVHSPLKPFAFESPYNNNKKTAEHSTPTNIYEYEKELGYAYDSLEFGGMNIIELDNYINANLKGKPRTFVGIHLHGIHKSAWGTVHVKTAAGTDYDAGHFALLGGPSEMEWDYDRVYRHDITGALNALNLHWSSDYEVSIEMKEFDGTPIDVGLFPKLNLIYKAPEKIEMPKEVDIHVRKNAEHLTDEEIVDLRHALANLEEDKSVGGYQDIARFHGTPRWCPYPAAEVKVACCPHGMPTFLFWHRSLTVQIENALHKHGLHGALPYWDWTQPMTHLPTIVLNDSYVDPSNKKKTHNPFYDAHIDDANVNTVRSVRPDLYQQPKFGEYTEVAKQVLLALEQDDYCDFAVQFEIAHNFLHALVGGSEQYSMASLKYTGYDPLFYLHHSNTDRLWALWQALQEYRGKPHNTANCAIGRLNKPMAPFSLTSDVNPDPVTREHSIPFEVFKYKTSFHYEYDNLEFNGLGIPQLNRLLEQNKGHDRVYVGFLLHGIHHSALVTFYICKKESECSKSGEFYLLGDEHEMDWSYDRLYKYEITDKLEELHLHYDDPYFIKYDVHDLTGADLGQPFPKPTVIHELGTSHLYGQEYREPVTLASHIRRNLETLSLGETESLRAAFLAIQEDHTYENIAAFHGKPGLCRHHGRRVACCSHGSTTFPSWHRLYVEQVEEALLEHGSSVAVPYWDWITPFEKLPKLISKATYYNSREQRFDPNPFFSGKVAGEDAVTTRDVQPQIYNTKYFYEQALYALEQDHFCDFEIQFEVLHNAIHSWLGGRAKYSMSTVDYTAFDPVFFLHHTNTDRLWAIWQELQRYRGLPYNEADCAINLMRKPMEPFNNKTFNKGEVTYKYSRPIDTFDYRNHFHYEYDNLEFNHMTIPQLDNLIKSNQKHGRVYAGFLINNIGLSADVETYICVPTGSHGQKSCNHKAGVFSILGGELEMPYTFDRLYKLEITKTIRDLGLQMTSAANFELKVEIHAANGSLLDHHVLPDPTIIFVPGTDEVQSDDGHVSPYLVRKSIDSLTPRETMSLIHALESLQADSSADGFQSIASFHALPPLCPSPGASERHACCNHGMATFLNWHRSYTVQFEDALRRHGSLVGVPYIDWTRSMSTLPHFLEDDNYVDTDTHETHENPWHGAKIAFESTHTERDVQPELFKKGPHGWDTWLFEQTLFALEQEDFCDFEVQLEIAHNAFHSWVGGHKLHSMAHLHYTSYDPAFYTHHANTDRIWALWQALQKHRGHNPNVANCALELMKQPLKPFSFGPPYNLNPHTLQYSKPEDTFEYEEHFHYRYDTLEFAGMNIPALDAFIKERQEHDRVYAGFLLEGFGDSADVNFTICDANKHCFEGGHFSILGGSAEMPWHFDRLYKYDITHQLEEHHVRYDDDYHFHVYITAINGTLLDEHLIHEPSAIFVPGHHEHHVEKVTPNMVRHSVTDLDERDIQSIQAALHDLQLDDSKDGWENIASFHGAPARCPDPEHPTVACCEHGKPIFPHWHRSFILQFEQALHRHGSSIALPYWDWTFAIDEIPKILTQAEYYDVWKDEVIPNPFAHGYVPSEKVYTVRDIQDEIHDRHKDGNHSVLLYQVLDTLAERDYCDFEVQFEILHNAMHYMIGGHQTYSMSSLEYSAYEPLFFIHHSFMDKIWAVWQELQRMRHLPYDKPDCALNYFTEPMKPFSFEGFNLNKFTREHALPTTLFHHEELGYIYDNLKIGGYTPEEIEHLIEVRQSISRVKAGFLLKGIKTSGVVKLQVCKGKECVAAGVFNLLGGPLEMPWAFDRLYKHDITFALKKVGLQPEEIFDPDSHFHLEVEVYDVEGHALSLKDVMPTPTIMFEPAHGAAGDVLSTSIAGYGVRKNVKDLTAAEIENLREAMRQLQEDKGPNGFQEIAGFHGAPGKCGDNKPDSHESHDTHDNHDDHDNHTEACCNHGTPVFPLWHRVYVKQWEDALTSHGAKIGIPYWDWTEAFKSLPALVTETENNPFHHGITFDDHITSRAPRDKLFNDPEFGSESFFYRQLLLALEQTDYCDFEVQFEITHNAIHSWVGGTSPYGMSTLEYTAYEPLFILHHSNVDRQFAIWQALQKFRGLPYNSANCDIQELRQPMRPFSDKDNVNAVTKTHSRGIDAFNYDILNYQYDDLNLHGHTISELNDILEHRKEEDHIYAEFLLHSLGTSADIDFELCDSHNNCEFAGTFAILGGPLEHPWAFDRLFKYDVTDVFKKMHLTIDSDFHFVDHITAVNGTVLDSKLIRPPTVQFVPGVKHYYETVSKKTERPKDMLLRKDVNQLTLEETANLREALNKLQQDQGPNGFEAIAGFHGAPFKCSANKKETYACCAHGMVLFPAWHRVYTVQFEQALKHHGAKVGIPYWDWTAPINALPSLISDSADYNPFYSYFISFAGHRTTRTLHQELFNPHKINGFNYLYYLALTTLEEDNFCDFEVQYEVLHNEVHALIGGNGTYSMATLDYSAFDPYFMIHHSTIDRIWLIWQKLQKLRHKPFNSAHCAGHIMDEPLHPFNFEDINTNEFTRINSLPNTVFDASHLGYEFDKLELNGHDVNDLVKIIENLRSTDRYYLGFVLYGQQSTLEYNIDLLDNVSEAHHAGRFHILGGEKEMPWAYERLFKYDVTDIYKKIGKVADHPLKVKISTIHYNDQPFQEYTDEAILVERKVGTKYDTVVIPFSSNNVLVPKIVVKKGTHIKFVTSDLTDPIEDLGSYTTLQKCKIPPFSYNTYEFNVVHKLQPGDHFFAPKNIDLCKSGRRIQVTVEDE